MDNNNETKLSPTLNALDKIAIILLIIGGLNWLLVGALNYDLVAAIFGSKLNIFSRLIYILVGISAIYSTKILF